MSAKRFNQPRLAALGAMRQPRDKTKPTKTIPEGFGTEKNLSHCS